MWPTPEMFYGAPAGQPSVGRVEYHCPHCDVDGASVKPLRCWCCKRFVKAGRGTSWTASHAYRQDTAMVSIMNAGTVPVGEELDALV